MAQLGNRPTNSSLAAGTAFPYTMTAAGAWNTIGLFGTGFSCRGVATDAESGGESAGASHVARSAAAPGGENSFRLAPVSAAPLISSS